MFLTLKKSVFLSQQAIKNIKTIPFDHILQELS